MVGNWVGWVQNVYYRQYCMEMEVQGTTSSEGCCANDDALQLVHDDLFFFLIGATFYAENDRGRALFLISLFSFLSFLPLLPMSLPLSPFLGWAAGDIAFPVSGRLRGGNLCRRHQSRKVGLLELLSS